MFWNKKKTIYLDHASTTLIDPQVLSVMNEVYEKNYFNPGALYAGGVLVAQKILECRKSVAKLLGTTSDHIVFTRGGTESCNMAILGILSQKKEISHVITSEIEHAAVLETLKDLEKNKKIELTVVPVDEDGVVIVDEIKKALRQETILVSIMYVNNEIGTIQPIKEIAKLLRWYRKQSAGSLREPALSHSTFAKANVPFFHVDAIQATNYLDINVERLGVDLMSLSGSKIYGPKSSGILYVRNRETVSSMFHGGDQEFGLRAGTEDTASIVGFTKALEITRNDFEKENLRLSEVQNYFFKLLKEKLSDFRINGAQQESLRVVNNINISVGGISGERLVIELNAKGICASSKSACKEDADEESHVIIALRKSKPSTASVEGSLRFTLGRSTTKRDMEQTVVALVKIVERIRNFEKSLK